MPRGTDKAMFFIEMILLERLFGDIDVFIIAQLCFLYDKPYLTFFFLLNWHFTIEKIMNIQKYFHKSQNLPSENSIKAYSALESEL